MLDAPAALDAEIQLLERRHAENPEGRFFVPLADRYRRLGELERAEVLLREGLQRLPEYASARVVLGQCLADLGRPEEAADEFRSVLAADSQNLLALRNLGKLAAAAGQREQASHWYGELLAVDPMNDDARRALDELIAAPPKSDALSEEAQVEDAHFEDVYEEVFEDPEEGASGPEPAAELATETIAELYSRQGFHEQAAEVYRELLRRRGEDPDLRRRLGEAELLAAGELPESPAEEPPRTVTISEALANMLAWPNGSRR